MKAPPAHERPSLASERRTNWKAWLLEEWGLLILAAALSILIFEITQAKVIDDHVIEDVELLLEVADEHRDLIGAVLVEARKTVDVKMYGSRRQRDQAREAMTEQGRPVLRLRIGSKIDSRTGYRDLTGRLDHWAWPFGNHIELRAKAEIPSEGGRVYRLTGRQQGAIASPKTVPAQKDILVQTADGEFGARVEIKLSRSTFEYLAPEGVVGSELTPDPIDLTKILESEQVPWGRPIDPPFPLSFSQWLNEGDKHVKAYRRTLPLPDVTATVTLRRVGTYAISNDLRVDVEGNTYEHRLQRQEMEFISNAGPLKFIGRLEGPKALIEKLENEKHKWKWLVHVPEPADGWPKEPADSDKPGPWVTIDNATIIWVPYVDEYRGKGIRFVPRVREERFTMRLRYNER